MFSFSVNGSWKTVSSGVTGFATSSAAKVSPMEARRTKAGVGCSILIGDRSETEEAESPLGKLVQPHESSQWSYRLVLERALIERIQDNVSTLFEQGVERVQVLLRSDDIVLLDDDC